MGKILNDKIVYDYEQLQKDVFKVIKAYGLSAAALRRKLNLSNGHYYNVLNGRSFFTIEEMKQICKFINRE